MPIFEVQHPYGRDSNWTRLAKMQQSRRGPISPRLRRSRATYLDHRSRLAAHPQGVYVSRRLIRRGGMHWRRHVTWNSDNNPRGGRPAGARNRLIKAILDDLLEDWREHGAAAIKLMRVERPGDYVRAASQHPSEGVAVRDDGDNG